MLLEMRLKRTVTVRHQGRRPKLPSKENTVERGRGIIEHHLIYSELLFELTSLTSFKS